MSAIRMSESPKKISQFEDKERFFIVTAGRTGSSLLASILAEAGADFGMPARQVWDESRGGSFEHPLIRKAAGHFRWAYDFSPQRPTGPSRWRWALARHFGKRRLQQVLTQVRYVKAINLDLTVQAAFKQGFFPRIIINHRRFAEHAVSLSQMFGHRSIDVLAADYLRTYGNALIQLQLYGGCVVGYEELTNSTDYGWILPLGTVTGLPSEALSSIRQSRIRQKTTQSQPFRSLGAESEDLFLALQSLYGRVVPPSAQALRNWERRTQK